MSRKRRPRIRSLWMQEVLESRRPLAVDINLLKDINELTTQLGLSPRSFTRVGPHVYFTGTTFAQGTELWRTDGTAEGTSLVKDIQLGPLSSSIGNLTAANGLLYFTAADGISGLELWRSDGTAEGTFMLADATAGPTGSSLRSFTPVGNLLYFVNNNTGLLWSSDGTTAGTKVVTGGFGSPSSLTNVDGTLYYVAVNGGFNRIHKLSEGVPQNLGFTTGQWRSTAVIAGDLYYSVDGQGVSRLSINSVLPPTLLRDTTGNVQLYNANGQLYFTIQFDFSGGFELYRSDGTLAGTSLLKALPSITSVTTVGTSVYFSGFETASGGELWRSDGTVAGTALVKEIRPGTGSSFPQDLTAVGYDTRARWFAVGHSDRSRCRLCVSQSRSDDHRL